MSLIKTTQSLCPECKKVLDADIKDVNGEVIMYKTCKEHGDFEDLLSIDSKHFRWSQDFMIDGQKPNHTCVATKKGCPYDCGSCPNHKSSPAIAIVDVTYRCNLKCPICFANAEARGLNYEPSFEELVRIFTHFRETIKPQPPICAMYAGGEPTMRNDLPDLLSECLKMGYQQLQIATNGIKLANIDYFQELIDAGMPKGSKNARTHTIIYLQFDGVERETYIKTRGADILDKKLKVIENARELNYPNIILVPTIANNVNEHETTKILQFGIDNVDVVNTIMYQPMAMCGRYEKEKLKELRITSSHLGKQIQEYTNGKYGKIYPLPTISKFAKCIAWLNDEPPVEFTCSADCGFANFMLVDRKTKELIGIEELFDSEEFLKRADKWYQRIEREKQREFTRTTKPNFLERAMTRLYKNAMRVQMFADLSLSMRSPRLIADKFFTHFKDIVLNTSWESSSNWLVDGDILLVGLMHFQDLYNFDLNRVSRCLVHYGYIDPATNEVRQVPFCAMNAIHRERIEDELHAAHKMEQYVPEIRTR